MYLLLVFIVATYSPTFFFFVNNERNWKLMIFYWTNENTNLIRVTRKVFYRTNILYNVNGNFIPDCQ